MKQPQSLTGSELHKTLDDLKADDLSVWLDFNNRGRLGIANARAKQKPISLKQAESGGYIVVIHSDGVTPDSAIVFSDAGKFDRVEMMRPGMSGAEAYYGQAGLKAKQGLIKYANKWENNNVKGMKAASLADSIAGNNRYSPHSIEGFNTKNPETAAKAMSLAHQKLFEMSSPPERLKPVKRKISKTIQIGNP